MAEEFELGELPDEGGGTPESRHSWHSDAESVNGEENNDNNNENNNSDVEDSSQSRKKCYHYTVKDDINIAIKCQEKKPFGKNSTKETWSSIAEELNLPVSWEGVKRRFLGEMKKFKKNNYKSKRGSGITEDYTRKDKLFTEMDSLMQDELAKKDAANLSERKKRLQQKVAGEGVRMEAVKRMKSSAPKDMLESEDELDSPIRETGGSKRRKTDEIVTLMRQKDDSLTKHRQEKLKLQKQEMEMKLNEHQAVMDERKQRLQLDERRLALEEKQHEFAVSKHLDEIELKRQHQAAESELKKRQQEMDEREKNMLLSAIKNNQKC